MNISSSPLMVEVDPSWNANSILADRVERMGDEPLIEVAEGERWRPITAREFADEVAELARGLIAAGVGAGDKIAIMSRTRYEWTLLDFAIWEAGAVSVPIYDTSSREQIRWICSDSAVQFAFAEDEDKAARIDETRSDVPGLKDIWVIERGAIDQLKAGGRGVDDATLEARRTHATLEDTATVIYTSGTTGRPKGTELTHANFAKHVANSAVGLAPVVSQPGSKTLLFLPLAHVFARFIEVIAVGSTTVIGHCPDTKDLMPRLATFRPSFLLAVPRVLEKVYNSAEQKAGKGVKLKMFRWAAKVGIVYSRAIDDPKGPGASLRRQHSIATKLVYHKLQEAMGGNLIYVVSGGAPLGDRLGHFYRALGLKVLEGYGLTETTAPIVVNRPDLIKIGSVGLPFPGTAVKIADDGEILAQGINVFARYHNNAEATEEAFADGWFKTGDLGRLDEDGYLYITGRKKEILVTAGGKNVAPAQLEDRLRGHPIVSQCVVVGDGEPFIGALLTLDAEMLPGWLANHGLPEMTVEEARANPDVLAALQRAVDRTNEPFSQAEQIRKFVVLNTDFTEDNGYLTPSLKVKRDLVMKDFKSDIDSIYATVAHAQKEA